MSHLLQLREGQWVAVLSSELHESHVGWMGKLCDDTETRKQSGKQTSATFKKWFNCWKKQQSRNYFCCGPRYFCSRCIWVHTYIKSQCSLVSMKQWIHDKLLQHIDEISFGKHATCSRLSFRNKVLWHSTTTSGLNSLVDQTEIYLTVSHCPLVTSCDCQKNSISAKH